MKISEKETNKVIDNQYLLVMDSRNLNINNKRNIVTSPSFSAVFLLMNPVGRLINNIEVPTITPQIIIAKKNDQCELINFLIYFI